MTPFFQRVMVRLVYATLALSSNFALASATSCDSKTTDPAPAQFKVNTSESLYGFSAGGNLYKSDFNGGIPQLLAKHHFGSEVNFTRSADKRWIAYSGSLDISYQASLNNLKADQVWLYDTKTGNKRLILERPAWSLAGVKASFSPDSRWIATTSDLDSRHPGDKFPGVFLTEASSGKTFHLGYPPGITPDKNVYSKVQWSRDGTRLLLYVSEGGSKHAYYSINPNTHAFQSISGKHQKNAGGPGEPQFLLKNEKMQIQEKYWPQSRIGYGKSSNGLAKAYVDEQHRLVFADASGKSHLIAKGSYEQCEGVTIRIQGWIADGRYLVYSISGEPYIVDLGTFKQKTMVLGPISAMNFFW